MNRMKLVVGLIFLGLGIHPLFADKTNGIVEEFTKVEEYYRNPPTSDEYKKKILEKNLLSAVRISLIKKYNDYEVVTKDLNPSSISWEIATGTYNCYVRYKHFYIFFMFATDPSQYLQTPVEERFYLKPENIALTATPDPTHQNDPKSKQEPKTPPATENKK